MRPQAYDRLAPVQWPLPELQRSGRKPRLFAEGAFFTPTRKAKFIAVAPPRLAEATNDEFPLLLNTGRMRDQWHTMTRTGLSPRLGGHAVEPRLAVHPDDAARAELEDGGLARGQARMATQFSG